MQCTPESKGLHDGCKVQHCYDCSDSGYSGLFHTPLGGVNSCTSLSPEDFNETPKENIKLSATPKGRSKESVRLLGNDSRGAQRSSAISWCETPKVYKRDVPLRHRLLLGTPTADVKNDDSRSPCNRRTGFSNSAKSEHLLSESFDYLDTVTQDLMVNTQNPEQDLPLSGRKRRFLFSQVRTSTLEDGSVNSGQLTSLERQIFLSEADFSDSISACETPCLSKCLSASPRERTGSPVRSAKNDLSDNSSVFTPSSTQTPKYIRCLYEDSGFSSLTLDKSQDSSVDHDGSFQELLLSAFRGNSDTQNLADTRWRSHLHRQHRLSTLKEGGSQSEEDQVDRKHKNEHQQECHSQYKDEDVFEGSTPSKVLGDALTLAKQDYGTPLRATTSDLESNQTFSATPINSVVTPLTASDLSLTPALQLVHALCQQNAQMFVGQSPSLQEQLKSTAALVRTPLMFRTTMPLAGLIGRKMGIGRMDILTELKKRNLRHILALVFSYMSAKCIHRCSRVCKSWNEIVQQDKRASLRRGIYLVEMATALELRGAPHVPDAETRQTLLTRSALKTVQAQSKTSSFCTPKSGSSTLTPLQDSTLLSGPSSSKRDKFLEVAKTLFSDECLKPCPRCQHPARCHSVKREGVCTNTDCGFQFCTACLCVFHGSRECGSRSVGRRRKDILLPGSAQSKRNIRRL